MLPSWWVLEGVCSSNYKKMERQQRKKSSSKRKYTTFLHWLMVAMQKQLIHLILVSILSVAYELSASDSSKNDAIARNPALVLNSQDVPIFYSGNPLEGLNAFAVLAPYSIQNPEIHEKIKALLEKELGSIGLVIRTKDDALCGFGSANILNLQIGKVSKWDGEQLPISRVTLSIETSVIIRKTNVKTSPRIWTINDFVDAPLEIKSEDKMIGAIQKLVKEFVSNYQFANPHQIQKPIFYIYE